MNRNRQPPVERQYEQEHPRRDARPPRPATEPEGAEQSTRTRKTATDPATGEPSDR
jgi:hypothetical protein